MAHLPFHIVDVFAEAKYAGNQLAVFRPAEPLRDDEMQRIAKEVNYSESTFILSKEQRDGGYDVRVFTPQREIPFAGHPTLGTAYVIQQTIVKKPVERILLNLRAGQIPVTLRYAGKQVDLLWMKQLDPTFGQQFEAAAVSQALSLRPNDLDMRFPIQAVSTGLPCILVPLKTLEALRRARIVREKYLALIAASEAKLILIFSPQTYNKGNQLSVRVFADYYGVPEDPATGSGNGCLAAYLVQHRYFGTDRIDVRVEQGYEIGRPSLLLLRARETRGKISIEVGGRLVMIARGEFLR